MPDPENPPGPTVVPGTYGVELTVGEKGKGKSHAAKFTVVKDPRLPTTAAEEYAAQFALHKAADRVGVQAEAGGQSPAQDEAPARGGDRPSRQGRALRSRTAPPAIVRKLSAIESVMVDPHRKSVRDVLRNPAGLNDTLIDMVAMATTADRPPTTQTTEVSREVMAKVDSEVAKFEALVKDDIAQLNAALAKARVKHVMAE